jgi:hypothetical protein
MSDKAMDDRRHMNGQGSPAVADHVWRGLDGMSKPFKRGKRYGAWWKLLPQRPGYQEGKIGFGGLGRP